MSVVFAAPAVLAAPASPPAAATEALLKNDKAAPRTAIEGRVLSLLSAGKLVITDAGGKIIAGEYRKDQTGVVPLALLLDTLTTARLTPDEAAALWGMLGDEDNRAMLTPELISALLANSASPRAHEALWSELAAQSRAYAKRGAGQKRETSLLGVFEQHRALFLPIVADVPETLGASDEMLFLMTSSHVFGEDTEASVAFVSERIPAAVARHIERERERGDPVRWEYAAYEGMIRWRDAHLLSGGSKFPATLAEFDAAGEAFIVIFNCLHTMDEGFREVILRRMGPVEVFNATVAGEKELYRLGTSGYRRFLHGLIMQGIKDAGSFEAFLAKAAPFWYGSEGLASSARRGLAFVRVASSFGLLPELLRHVRNRGRFIEDAIASLSDSRSFEVNSAVVMDILTTPSAAESEADFKRELYAALTDRFRTERNAKVRSVYGSLLSVYQAVSGQQRDERIAAEFATSEAAFSVVFDKVFAKASDGAWVHRMFVRFGEDESASGTYAAFRTGLMALGARERVAEHFSVYSISRADRRIDIYANAPGARGVKQGISNIARELQGQRIDTIIGRGHTSIIEPLQADAKRILGARTKAASLVIVGACGGDASVRNLISTFGYVPIITTKATGRQMINEAIISAYIGSLMKLEPAGRLDVAGILQRAVKPFTRAGVDDEIRADAALYQVNMTAVLTARLFDEHLSEWTARADVAGK